MNKTDLIRATKIQSLFRPFAGIGHVMLFHSVTNDFSKFNQSIQVSPGYIEGVLEYFTSSKTDIVTLDECYNRLNEKGRTRRFVAFTFDDGYADNLTNALPLFEKYNAPFTLFLTTGFPDHSIVILWSLLEEFVLSDDDIQFEHEGNILNYRNKTLNEKRESFFNIRNLLRRCSAGNFIPVLKKIFNKDEDEIYEPTRRLALTWDQVRFLSSHPLVTIGAHTVNHQNLKTLREEEVISEIRVSAGKIEEITGKQVDYFAYPFGGIAEAAGREYRIARACGLKMAFTANNGSLFKYHSAKLFSLPRLTLNENWTVSHIDLYVNGLTPVLNRLGLK